MKKLLIIVIVLLIGVVGFSTYSSRTHVSNPLTIAYIGPLTGPSAVLGMDAVKAVQIGIDEINEKGGINGTPIKFIQEDDQYLTKNTLTAYRKLVDIDKAKIILVANYGGVLALKDLAKKDKVVVIDPLDCNADVAVANKNLFCIATETESIGQSLSDYLVGQNKMTAAIMYSTKDQFMLLVTNAFRETYESQGGHVVVEQFNYDDTSFRTQLSKIKLENPDALVLLGHDETGIIMKQARDIGITAPFLTTGTITSPSAQELAKGNAEGTIFAFWDADQNNTESKAFIDKFVKLVGRPPILPLTTHPAYDVIQVLAHEVLPNVKGEITDEKINTALLQVKNFKGITGEISIDKTGAAPIKESVYKLAKGMPVKI